MGDRVGRFDVHRDELDRRIHAAGLEEAPGQRVVEGLVQLAVDQIRDEPVIAVAHRRPQRAVMRVIQQRRLQAQRALGDAFVVQLDALHRVTARTGPVHGFEAAARPLRDLGEARVVVRKGVVDEGGDDGGLDHASTRAWSSTHLRTVWKSGCPRLRSG